MLVRDVRSTSPPRKRSMVVMKLNPIASPSSASVPGSINQKAQKAEGRSEQNTEIPRDDGDGRCEILLVLYDEAKVSAFT
ncbi:hypothetical protein BHE74_00000521 [Ensete ventricosum]|nr:hypothetical protein BHE74_00000521 [Ensete ventricosum]